MRKLFPMLLLVVLASTASAQQAAVNGSVSDTLGKRNLANAVVLLLHQNDSTLYRFCRTDENGAFSFSGVAAGAYRLLVSYPKFADYTDVLQIDATPKDLGTIALTLKSQLLDAVVIRQNMAIRLKGDTVEYRADSFYVAEGASVKELLRKMPGLQVDRNGQVTAQGEKVNKILVDGEEFFSDDPAVVIENLRADAIDKVQSYDKKSDQAEFTGVDDGSRSKTLNLVLKENKKKGLLGKIVLGAGTEERYSSQAMLNYFKGKKKISAYGISSNTGITGLGWNDRSQFGKGIELDDENVEMGAGFIMITSSDDDLDDDWSNTFEGEGVPKTTKAGLHFSDKWAQSQQAFNGNYSFKNQRVRAEGNSLTKYLLPDSAYYSKESHTSRSRQTQNLITTTFDLKLDSLSSVRIRANGLLANINNSSTIFTETDDEDLQAVNKNRRTTSLNNDDKTFVGSLLWRQKFTRRGRTLSLSASYKNVNAQSSGFLASETDFFSASGQQPAKELIDQYKINSALTTTTKAKLVFTEPVGKNAVVELNYMLHQTGSSADRRSFNQSLSGKYDEPDPLFSNKYALQYGLNSAGFKYQYNGKKLTANVGTNMGVSAYTQKSASGQQTNSVHYTNLFPAATFNYKFAAQRRLRLTYAGVPQSPSLEQLQPVRENTNPLFITVGNPLLQQGFNHRLSLNFNDYKTLSGRSIYISGSYQLSPDAIVTSQTIKNGVTTQQYVNADGNYNADLYADYNRKVGRSNSRIGLSANVNKSRYVNFVNGQKNRNEQTGAEFGPSYFSEKENLYELQLYLRFGYNSSESDESRQKVDYWTQNHEAQLTFFFTKKLRLNTDAKLHFRQQTDAFAANNNFIIWNANLEYRLFPKNNGSLKLEMNDLLNQRTGFDRNISSNSIYERHYNTLGQYLLLSFTWNFTKNFGTETN